MMSIFPKSFLLVSFGFLITASILAASDTSVMAVEERYAVDFGGQAASSDLVILGTVQGFIGKQDQLIADMKKWKYGENNPTYSEILRKESITNPRQWPLPGSPDPAPYIDQDGFWIRVKIHKVFEGNVTNDVVDVFKVSPSFPDWWIGDACFLFLQKEEFKKGICYMLPEGRDLLKMPGNIDPQTLKDVEKGKKGICQLLRPFISDRRTDVSSDAAVACAMMQDNEAVEIIRKKLDNYQSETGAKDDRIIAFYVIALLHLKDTKTLISYADWLVEHPEETNTGGFLQIFDFPPPSSNEERKQLMDAFTKIARSKNGLLKADAENNIRRLSQDEKAFLKDLRNKLRELHLKYSGANNDAVKLETDALLLLPSSHSKEAEAEVYYTIAEIWADNRTKSPDKVIEYCEKALARRITVEQRQLGGIKTLSRRNMVC